jgi:hypothetical protein
MVSKLFLPLKDLRFFFVPSVPISFSLFIFGTSARFRKSLRCQGLYNSENWFHPTYLNFGSPPESA